MLSPGKKSERIISIGIISFVFLIGVVIYFYASHFNQKAISAILEKKESIKTEKTDPVHFLLDKSILKHAIKDRHLVLEGSVFNNATSTTYGNIVLKITFYNENSVELGRNDMIINESISPKQTIGYTKDLNYAKNIKYAVVAIIGADLVESI